MRTSQRLSTLLAVSAGALLAAAGCGDDDGNNPDARPRFDARTFDGGDDEFDAGPDARGQTRSGTIAVSEVRLTTPGATSFGGSAISISFDNVLEGGVEPVIDTGTPGGCVVRVFEGKDAPHPTVDEGPVVLGGAGILLPTGVDGACTFVGGAYRCITANVTGQTATATALGAGAQAATTYNIVGATFDSDQRGQWATFSGFAEPLYNGTFPIVSAAGSTLTVINSQTVDPDTGESPDPSTSEAVGYILTQGVGPVPNGANPAGPINYLSDNPADRVTVTMPPNSSDTFPEGFSKSLAPIGAGFELNEASAVPEAFPTSAEEGVIFSCAGPTPDDDDSCGTVAVGAYGVVVSGRATNGTPNPAAPFLAPTDATRTVTFTCSSALLGDTVEVPANVIAAILGDDESTWIETRVLRVSFDPFESTTNDLNSVNIVVGHGIVGHTLINREARN